MDACAPFTNLNFSLTHFQVAFVNDEQQMRLDELWSVTDSTKENFLGGLNSSIEALNDDVGLLAEALNSLADFVYDRQCEWSC